jgi:glycosyltransferase involved in cell wall biosynthesis
MATILLISPYWKEDHRWMVSTVKLAELWQRMGYNVVVACMGAETGEERISDTLTICRRKDYFLPDPWNYGISLGFSRFVNDLVDRERPDLIIVNKVLFWSSLSIFGLRLRGHRVLLTTDALVGISWWPRGKLAQVCAAIYAWTLGWLVLLAAWRIVFFHPQTPGTLKQLGIARKSRVIPTGIDEKAFAETSGEGRGANECVVSYVGRLESVKGVDDFVAASAPLKSEFPNLKIQVVGFYKDGNTLVNEYKDRVTFTGLRHDIPEVLQGTNIFVLPSYSEGLSNALMEAMSSGCACIASEVGGNSFLIQNGVSGLLFPAGDQEALRSHIRRLLEDSSKRLAMGEAAKKRIKEVFSWDVVRKQYEKLFAELETKHTSAEGKTIVILSAFATPYRSGAEACAEEVAAKLKEKFTVTIVTSRLSRNLPKVDRLPSGVLLKRVGFGTKLDPWLFPFLAPFAARSLKPDLLHAILESFAGASLLFCRILLPGVPRVLTLQSTNTEFLLKQIHSAAHRITAISQVLATRAAHLGFPAVTIIPNGVDLAALTKASPGQKIPGRILFVGRLEPMKGVDILLRALNLLPSELPWSCEIVGDGSQKRLLEDLMKELKLQNRVAFRGKLIGAELMKAYGEAQIFCGLSRSEALGNVFLEAQAAGCAVLGTNVGGIPEIVKDGETGLLVEPDNVEASAKALERLLNDSSLRHRLAEAGKAHAQAFDWSVIAEKYAEIYKQMLVR